MLTIPDLIILRHWLEKLNVNYFECDTCMALHLPHLQSIEGIFDAKIDLIDNVILFSALAEIRQTAIIPLTTDLSQINASSLTNKVFVDIQDDNLPKLVVCQSLSAGVGITIEQFGYFLQEAETQATQIMLEAKENGLLLISEAIEDITDEIEIISEQLLH